MGGNIAWTVRKEDGTEFRMERWTNIFPDVTVSDEFLSGDPAAFDAAMKSWLDMKADWEENKATGKYRHNMTSVYAPYPGLLAPSEYGFLVTDFVSKTIISCNDYTRVDSDYVYGPSARLRMDTTIKGEPWADYDARLKKLWDAGRIRGFGLGAEFTPVGDMSFSEVVDAAIKEFNGSSLGTVLIDPIAPWTLMEFRDIDVKAERRAAYYKVKELGFLLTDEEEKVFARWIAKKDW